MEQYHGKSKTKLKGTGGKKKKRTDKKLYLMGGPFTATKAGDKEVKKLVRGRGGTMKLKVKKTAIVSVLTKDGVKKAKIRTVIETPANRHFARQNIVVKGAIIDTELGKVKVTNRVGQDGVVNGVLL